MTSDPLQIQSNYAQVMEKVAQAAQRVGRQPSSVKLIVVTKSHPLETAIAAIEAGARFLGENYADEGLEKVRSIGAIPGLEWHMIGHVQSRKVSDVVRSFSLIHSVDSIKLAEKINRVAEELSWIQDVLIQVNVSGEESKFGFSCWKDEQIPDLEGALQNMISLRNLRIMGLMTIPPFVEEGEKSRPFFQRIRQIRDHLSQAIPSSSLMELSMGMSADYEIAIEEGATLVRVGTAILGERTYTKG